MAVGDLRQTGWEPTDAGPQLRGGSERYGGLGAGPEDS